MSALRLIVLARDAAFSGVLRDVFDAELPGSATEALDAATLKSRPVADAVTIDARDDAARGAALATRLRAMGFAGAIVVVTDGVDADGASLSAAGASHVSPREIADRLVPALAEQMALAGGEHAAQVMRARRLIAAGEIAMKFQHSLNNPLAGILAEAQLMQLESVTPDQHAALERIVGLCRRIIDLGKSLDGLSERK